METRELMDNLCFPVDLWCHNEAVIRDATVPGVLKRWTIRMNAVVRTPRNQARRRR